MKKSILVLSLVLASASASAAWKVETVVDDFTDEKSVKASALQTSNTKGALLLF